jgi:PHD/YefM family antitoxin component YafN of YafNO toxin-antitoxin module
MLPVHPQYLKDSDGNNSLVVLPVDEFEAIMEELEDLEDVRLYDEAKREDDGERISMEDAFRMIEAKRNNQ